MRLFRILQNYGFPLAVLVLGVGLQLVRPYPLAFFQNIVFDQYNRWHPRIEAGMPVLYVDIDEASLSAIGQFPWPRNVFAQMIDRLSQAGATAIAFDILFTEPDRTAPEEILPIWRGLVKNQRNPITWQKLQADISQQINNPDAVLAAAIARAPVILPTVINNASPDTSPDIGEKQNPAKPKAGIAVRGVGGAKIGRLPHGQFALANQPAIENAAIGLGAINAHIDRDGIMRRAGLLFRVGEHIYPSLALESLRVAQGAGAIIARSSDVRGEGNYFSGAGLSRLKTGDLIVPIEPDGTMRLYFTQAQNLQRLSAQRIIKGDFDTRLIDGKIIFVGTSAAGLKDMRATPLNPATPGVELHVQIVQQLLSGAFLRRPIWLQISEAMLVLMAGLGLIMMVHKMPMGAAFAALLAISALMAYSSWAAFTQHLVLVDIVAPTASNIAVFLAAAGLKYVRTSRERQQIRNAFRYYLAPDMVARLAANPQHLKLGGEIRNLTILFADIRGFTAIAEIFKNQPDRLTHIINIFLTDMSQIIQAYAGTIDKYIGDNIMAFWNAPSPVPCHAYQAGVAALEMVAALDKVNEKLRADALLGESAMLDNWRGDIKIGIGLNSGDTLVGNIGSQQRFNYSVMGDTVNIASRLEGQTKIYDVPVLVGEQNYHAAMASGAHKNAPLAFIELDLIMLKGKATPERVFALLGDARLAQAASFQNMCAAQQDFLRAYRQQNWKAAKQLAKQIGQKHPILRGYYATMCARIAVFEGAPPKTGWNGSY